MAIEFNFEDIQPQPELVSPTVIGVVGTGTGGSPQSSFGVPVAAQSIDEVNSQFGSEGTICLLYTSPSPRDS